MTLDRRTVVRGTAWTLPAVLVSTQAPAFAASPCGAVPFPTGWSLATTGTFQNGIQTYSSTYAAADTINRFVSEADNSVNSGSSENTVANTATVRLETTMTLVPGRAYTFSFSIASRFSGDNSTNSQNQYLQIQTVVGGTPIDRLRLVKGSNTNTYLGGLATWTQLTPTAVPPGPTGPQVQTYSFPYTPPAGTSSVLLRLLWTLPARGRVGGGIYSGQADIAVSAPTITGQGC